MMPRGAPGPGGGDGPLSDADVAVLVLRAVALLAAAAAWSGTPVSAAAIGEVRDGNVLGTAGRFEEWLLRELEDR